MRSVAIINQKGGVGKTTTTVNLGAALARSGSRVLLVDLDPQGHLGLHLGVDVPEGEPTIYDVLTDELPLRQAIVSAGDRLDVLPSNIDLAAAESELVSVLGREVLLRDALEQVASGYDMVLIDCPPSLGVLTINALVAASEVLIPLQAQFFALQGFSKLLDKTVRLVRQRINPALEVLGVILCMHEKQTRLSGEVVEDIRGFLEASRGEPVAWANAKVYDICVRRNVKLAEATSFGQSVLDYAPKSNGAQDYLDLAVEIFGAGASSASVAAQDEVVAVEKMTVEKVVAPAVTPAVAPVVAAPVEPVVKDSSPTVARVVVSKKDAAVAQKVVTASKAKPKPAKAGAVVPKKPAARAKGKAVRTRTKVASQGAAKKAPAPRKRRAPAKAKTPVEKMPVVKKPVTSPPAPVEVSAVVQARTSVEATGIVSPDAVTLARDALAKNTLARDAVAKEVGALSSSSPLTKGGSRGVLPAHRDLPQPLHLKEGGKKANDSSGNGTGVPAPV